MHLSFQHNMLAPNDDNRECNLIFNKQTQNCKKPDYKELEDETTGNGFDFHEIHECLTIGRGGCDRTVGGWGEFEITKRQAYRDNEINEYNYTGMTLEDVVDDIFNNSEHNKPAFEAGLGLYDKFVNILKKQYKFANIPPIYNQNRQFLMHGTDLMQLMEDARYIAKLLGILTTPEPPKLKQLPITENIDCSSKTNNELEELAKPSIIAIEKRQIEVAKYISNIQQLID